MPKDCKEYCGDEDCDCGISQMRFKFKAGEQVYNVDVPSIQGIVAHRYHSNGHRYYAVTWEQDGYPIWHWMEESLERA